MGKRELLIVVILAAVGVVVWQVTAPPPGDGQGFSWSRLLGHARRELGGNQPIASHTAAGTVAVGRTVTELRVTGVPRGVQIIGEARTDIAWELAVESSGPDEATALGYAKQVAIRTDDLGASMALRVTFPREATQWAALTLNVPQRLAIRLEGGIGLRASDLAALELDRVSGLATAENITGGVTGSQTSGELTIAGAGTVDLTLSAARVRLSRIARGITLNTRSGRCEVADSQGPIEISASNTDVTIAGHAGPIQVSGSGGRVTVDGPRQAVRLDVRRAPVTLTLTAPIVASVFASDERVRLILDGPPAVTIDAAAVAGGRIDASEFGLVPEMRDDEQRLTKTFGTATAPRVTLRNTRGDIVIASRK